MSNGLDKRDIPIRQPMADGTFQVLGNLTVRRGGQVDGFIVDYEMLNLVLDEAGLYYDCDLRFTPAQGIAPWAKSILKPDVKTDAQRDKSQQYRISLFARAKEIVDQTIDITDIRPIDMDNVVFSAHEQYLDLIIKVAEWLMGEDFE